MYLAIAAGGGQVQLHSVDTSTNPFTFPTIGDPASGYNAIGYDPNTNYIYTVRWDSTTSRQRLLRIGADGTVEDMGVVAGGGINQPPSQFSFATGVVGADGFYYGKFNGPTDGDADAHGHMYRIDLSTRTAVRIDLTFNGNPINIVSADFAWHNGLLYSHDHANDRLYTVDPGTGAVDIVGTSNVPAAGFGSMISATNGVFGRDNNGAFYRFDTATGEATLISDAPEGAGDGAKCPTTAVTLPADTQITKTDNSQTYDRGGQVSYTIVVSNGGPFGVQNALVNDALPADITTASWTCGSPTNGATCSVANGTGGISNVAVNLPASSSVTFTLTMDVPLSFTGELTNAATVTNPADVPDPDTSNNTASDTDIAAPLLTLEKAVVNDDGGTAAAADFTLSASGPVTVSGVSGSPDVTDAAVPAGTYSLSETNQPGYTASDYSCSVDGGAPVAGNSITLENEQVAVCTITNDDAAPTLTLSKNLINDDVGTATTDDFTLQASGPVTISGVSGDPAVTGAVVPIGTYTLSETTLPDYVASDYSCTVDGGAPVAANSITLDVGDDAVCTVTNDDAEPTDLAITKTNGSDTYNPGGQTIYTIVVTNNGPLDVVGALVNDPLPAPASGASWTCVAGAGGVCGAASGAGAIQDVPVDLQVAGTVTFTFTVDIPAGTQGELVNNATVTNPPETPDSNLANNTAADGDIYPLINRSKTLTGEDGLIDGVAEPGETLTYQVALENPSALDDVVFDLTDNIDDNTTYVAGSATVDGTPREPDVNGDPLQWIDLNVPAQTTVTVEYSVLVDNPLPDGVTEIGNAATSDCNAFPNACTSLPTPGTAVPSKELTGEDGLVDDVAEPGETLTYAVTLSNSDATAALYDLSDNIDDNTTYVAGSATVGGTAQDPAGADPLEWNDLIVPANGTLEVVYSVTVADPLPDGVTEIRNAATDDCSANPDACTTTSTPGTAVPSKNLTGEDGLIAGVAEPGETLTYTVTLTNPGNAGALYDLTDNIDDNTSYIAGSATVGDTAREPDSAGDPLAWNDLVVPANGTLEVIYSVTVADPIPDGVTEIRNAATNDCVAFPDACTSTRTPGVAAPSKELTGEDGLQDGVAEAGERLTYTVALTNETGAAALYDLADNIDDSTAYVAGSATVGGTAQEPDSAGDPLVWRDLVVPANGTLEVIYSVTVADPIPEGVTEIRNIAYEEGTPEPDCSANPGRCVVIDPQDPSLALVKGGEYEDVDGDGVSSLGDLIRYTFTVTNTGNVPLADVAPRDDGPVFGGQPAENDLSAYEPEKATLEPGEEGTFTATYSLGSTDIDNGAGIEDGVENTATAIGYANGTQVTGTQVESDESVSVLSLPLAASDISVVKIAGLRQIRRGEQVPFTIRVTNNAGSLADGLTVIDTMPSGFRYVEGSATVNGEAIVPEVQGRSIRFEDLTLKGNGELDIRLRLQALSSAGPGKHTNEARATDVTGRSLAPAAKAVVEILVEPVFDCGDVIGKVFDDVNQNGYQDDGEPGLPGVRIATVKGWLVTTDEYGRFHVACAMLPDQRIGSNFIMKLDTRTLPAGYRVTTENPRVVRLTAGKTTKLNFGAAIGRVVRLDLKDRAFEPGSVDLKARWADGIDRLIDVLRKERAILRLNYIGASADEDLAKQRVDKLRDRIAERWRRNGGSYRLEIETRVEAGQ